MNRGVRVKTPLGDDVLLFEHMTGREMLGGVFQYDVSLLSEDGAVDLSALLGQTITIEVDYPESGTRYFNGHVVSFSMNGFTKRHFRYHVVLRPWLWLLSLGSSSRIFQNKTVTDIVKEIFRARGFSDFREALDDKYRTWEYSVQYRESDFNYISRLLEQEGIYYFFEHVDGKHTLVLADSSGAHAVTPGFEEIAYFAPGDQDQRDDDHLNSWSMGRQMRPGVFSSADFDFTRPTASLTARLNRPMEQVHADFEVYDYPGEYLQSADGEKHVKVRLDEHQADFELVQAAGTVRGLTPGALFKLKDHPRADQNAQFLIVAATYQISSNLYETGGGSTDDFEGTYTCMRSNRPYRVTASTPKPKVDGPQTAIVVGPAGKEIWTDKYGRVKVKFHWDRDEKRDDTVSCWVRVAQVWAGAKWGALHVPRIGHEVIIDFLEGDPDRPIVTGRVYNGDNMPPYLDPEAATETATQSGIKSRSTPGGSPNNFNEIRFEDKKGKEEVFIQAEKNKTVKVKNDRSASIGANDSISVGGDRSVSVTGNLAVTVSGGGKSPNHSSHSVTGKYNLHASDTIEEDAPTHIKLVCGDSYFLMEPGKITLFAGGKAMIVLDNHVLAASSDESVVVLDENAFAASKKGGKVLLDANVKAQSKAESTLVLDGDATVVTKGDVKLGGANVQASGQQKVTANGGGSQLELSAAGANLSGQKVGISGASMTEITGALVKIN